MRSHGLIIAPDIINNGAFSLSDILVAALGHSFSFKASKEALYWGRVVPTVATMAHALYDVITISH